MKQFFWMSLFGLGAVVLGGCPIYPDNGGGSTQPYCTDQYGNASTSCGNYTCNYSTDCPSNYTCENGQCVSSNPTPDASAGCTQPSDCASGQNCGSDGQCHAGDCSNSGCPSGFQCKLSNGSLQCIGSATRDGGATGDAAHDSGFSGCMLDSDCASVGAGAKCLDGTCVKAQDQCFDGTQCPSNDQCVAGVCTPSCDGTHPCPAGYSCDSKGLCTGNPTPCGSGGTMCTGTSVCVGQHCVEPCGVGNSCPNGSVCVAGGCIPDQKPQFVCAADGSMGDGMPGNCAVGSVCLHHSCYIECTSTDGGAGGCRAADKFNICKQVLVSGSTYSVCGSSTNLGSDCDPTAGKNCDAGVCIDGYCR